ncbi:hypothetical protein [Lacticaseibacillus camelliae]|nr:hypothetical protein [Lacticaseibacillus camelliae]
MTLTLRKYGERDGEFLYEYVLTNHNGMRVTLMNFGATLEKVEVPSGDHLVDVILSLKKPEDYAAERNLLGSTVGRIIGRLPGHVWHSGKRLLDLPAGEGPNHIHGGLDGLDRQVWTGTYRSEKSQDTVTFTYLDPDGHNQFPGNVLVTVSYTLADDNAVTYSINAVTDQMTLFNPSNHVYFALDGPNTTIEDTTLTMASDYYGP